MKKIYAFLRGRYIGLVCLLIAAVFGVFLAYFRKEFLIWQHLPLVAILTVLCGVCFAAAPTILYAQSREKRLLPVFFGAIAFYEIVLWGLLTVINVDGQFNRQAIGTAYGVLLPIYGVLCLLLFLRLARDKRKHLRRTAAALLCLGYIAGAAYPLYPTAAELYYAFCFTDQIDFETLSAEDAVVSQADKDLCEEWFRLHFLSADPVFDFSAGGERLRDDLAAWEFSAAEAAENKYRGGQTYTLSYVNDARGLKAEVEATLYAENATCEWTVFLTNTGDQNSPVITDFYAADTSLATGKTTIYCSKGTNRINDDFTLLRAGSLLKTYSFTGNDGCSSVSFMPYFNFSGSECSVVMSVGWTGQWAAKTKTSGDGVHVDVKQQYFDAYLLPGETVRSPLVSLSFYTGDNPLKGFNQYRKWAVDSVYPENVDLFGFTGGPVDPAELKNYDPVDLEYSDFLWYDADGVNSWYTYDYTKWGEQVGNWVESGNLVGGFDAIYEEAKKYDLGLLVWYEPERCAEGTLMYNEGIQHPGWILKTRDSDVHNNIWNLADEDAFQYLLDTILTSLKKNHVAYYRQDSNANYLPFWLAADQTLYDGRTGITENHYVTNLYRYFDGLLAGIPGLLIDNCASGGRRLDLEMSRRSIPLWPTDYFCEPHDDRTETLQTMAYGLSFWIPYYRCSGTGESDYTIRSSIAPEWNGYFSGEFREQREQMLCNFYPLSYAGTAMNTISAVQYDRDGAEGFARICKRPESKENTYQLYLNGLYPDKNYEIYNYDTPGEKQVLSGDELMRTGVSVALEEAPTAAIYLYQLKK